MDKCYYPFSLLEVLGDELSALIQLLSSLGAPLPQ